MQEVFEKIIEELDAESFLTTNDDGETNELSVKVVDLKDAIEVVEQIAAECGVYAKNAHTGWIPVESGKFPENEEEVEITFVSKHYGTGETLYSTTRAFYEDGTFTTDDSAFNWYDENFEYEEEKDAYIIPEGWYEGVSFAEEFGFVDMPVIAWRYLTEPYQQNICGEDDCPYNDRKECPAWNGCGGYETKGE